MEIADDTLARPFSTTCVFYRSGDPFGEVVALVSLTPIFLMVVYATLLASRRDLATAALLVGQLLNELLNHALKKHIKEARPDGYDKWNTMYGMPSNHSQFMAFLAGYVSLWALRRWNVRAGFQWLVVAGVHAGSALVMMSRCYLKYHTWQQVAAGYAVGVIAGAAWFAIVEQWIRPLFPWIASWEVSKLLLVRDCTTVNVIEVEYDAVTRAASGSAKLSNAKKGA